jgi:hypothetical protein
MNGLDEASNGSSKETICRIGQRFGEEGCRDVKKM